MAYSFPLVVVGRDRETELLQRRLDAATAGNGSLVLVGGEAGIGKSTLLSQLTEQAREREVQVFTAIADDFASSSPFGIWVDLLRDIQFHNRLSGIPDWLTSGSSHPQIDTRAAMFHEVHRFLADANAGVPAALILEDLHQADVASLELLRYLNRRMHNLPILMAASYRSEELPASKPLYQILPELVREGTVERIQLGQLDDTAVRHLISSRYEVSTSDVDRLSDYVWQHAAGNPLFITEILRSLEDEYVIDLRSGTLTLGVLDQTPVPPLVRQMIDGRLRRLDERVRWMISVAAMLGHDIPIDAWQRVLGADDDELAYAIDAGVGQHIIVQHSSGSLSFSHPLFREVLQRSIMLPRRRNLHRQIAEALIEAPPQERDLNHLAYHLWAARDDRAAEWLVQAGIRASNVYAYEIADDYLSKALDVLDTTEDEMRREAFRARASAREMMGWFRGALDDHQSALSIARASGNRSDIWETLIDLGDCWAARDYQEVGAYYQQALDLAREMGDSRTLAHNLNRIGNWMVNLDQPGEGLGYHDHALQQFHEMADETGIAQTLDLQALAAYMHGDMQACAAHGRNAIRMFREQHDYHGLASTLPMLMLTGGSYESDTVPVVPVSYEAAIRLGDEGLEVAREIGWRAGEAFMLSQIALATGVRGVYQQAISYAGQGKDLATDIDHREWVTAGHFALGNILVDCLNPHSAREHLTLAYESAVATHSLFWSRVSAATLAWAYLAMGDVDHASNILARVVDSRSGYGSIGIRQCRFRQAEVELGRSNPDAALEIADQLISTIPNSSESGTVPHLDWLRGRTLFALGRYEEAETRLDDARYRALELGYRPLLWRIDLAYGQLFAEQGHREAATQSFGRVHETVMQLAREIDDSSIRTEFRKRALSMLPVELRGSSGDQTAFGLSERERQVLELVARGMTDSEVGDALYISPRTVGRHLQSIYLKLGVSSRTAAARIATDRRLI